MKVAIIGIVGLPSKYGGFETFVEHVTQKLIKNDDITVYCSSREYSVKLKEWNGVKLKYIPFKANGVQSIIYDIISIFHALNKNDVLLLLGVSGCLILPFIKLISSKKIITNIDGLEWRRAKWSRLARWLLKFSEKTAVRYSDEIVSDNKVIQEYVLQEYGQASHLIEYGADHVVRVNIPDDCGEYKFLNEKYAFTVCRIEPENNIHIMLEAFSRLESKNLKLVIVGNWSLSNYSKDLKKKYFLKSNIVLLNPIYDQYMLNMIRSNCYIYIHGHSAGGTNPSLIEAMYLHLPIIAYDVNFNRETTENRAIYFKNSEDLSCKIIDIESLPLQDVADEMHMISYNRYRWDLISDKYSTLFRK